MAHIIVKVLNFISKFAAKIWLRLWSLISFEVLFVHDFSGEEQGVDYMSESAFIYVNLNAYVNWKYDCIFFFFWEIYCWWEMVILKSWEFGPAKSKNQKDTIIWYYT